MVKKYSKDTFRHTKKNVLHKKGVNSKKRGLRGGAINTRAIIDEQGLHGITPFISFSREKDLTEDVCRKWFENIKRNQKLDSAFDGNGNLKLTPTGSKDYNICSSKLNDTSIERFKQIMEQAKKQGERDVENDTQPQPSSKVFKTKLVTNKTTMDQNGDHYYVGLTLDNCRAVKRPFMVRGEKTPFFEYSIFSPAATTKPPNGDIQQDTHIGTFTQLPISVLLQMAGGQATPFSFASFYNTDEKSKSYFTDYLSCLENVKEKFGPEVEIDSRNAQSDKFRSLESSILRRFGKSAQCKIVLVAGNVGIQIQDPVNGDAIFVLPSQLNGAEYKYPQQAKIIKLNDYKEDPTAGPLGQLSCHPAVAQFVLDHAARKLPDGTSDFTSDFLVINAIDEVIEELQFLGITSLTLNNGYLQVPATLNGGVELELKDGENPSQNATAIFDSLSTRLKVLQTEDVPTSGLKPPRDYKEFNFGSTTKATPIYASAVPLKYGLTINPEKSTLQYCVAGFDLVAQYFGAMVSAYNKSKKLGEAQGKKVKLFLTPLGGGVFNNPREMIACSVLLAYYQAQQLFSDFDNSVQVIFLAWDGNPNEVGDFGKFFNTKEEQESLPEATSVEIQSSEKKDDGDGDGDSDVYPTEGWELGWKVVVTGDELYEKYKFWSLKPPLKPLVNDAESYRKRVLEKFKKEESYYDELFLGSDYKYYSITEKINDDTNLFDKLMELLSLTLSANLHKKLLFIHDIFSMRKPSLTDITCSRIVNIIVGLSLSSNVPVSTQGGGSKSRRKPARKTRRGRGRTRKSKSKSKSKTHRHRRHSRVRVRKHKKYTSRMR